MKKIYLLFLSIFTASAMMAVSVLPAKEAIRKSFGGIVVPSSQVDSPKKRVQPNIDGVTLQFCDELYTWLMIARTNKVTYRCYIEVSPEIATQLAGNKLTEISFSSALFLSKTRPGSIFVYEDMNSAPVTSTACTVVNSQESGSLSGKFYQTEKLDEPYVIKADTPFFFGFEVESCFYTVQPNKDPDYPVGIDGMPSNGFSGVVDMYDTSGKMIQRYDLAQEIGTNLFLSAKTVGDVTSLENLFMLGSLQVGEYTLPVQYVGEVPQIYVPVNNIGSNSLTSIDFSMSLNGDDEQDYHETIDIDPYARVYLLIQGPAAIEGNNIVNLNIKKINGVEVDLSSSGRYIAINEGTGYRRKFVIEEATGAWCGACPAGIVAMDYMADTYPDDVIPIAVHYNDGLQCNDYQPLLRAFVNEFPSVIVNRDPIFTETADTQIVDAIYKFWKDQPSVAKIDLVIYPSEDGSKLTAKAGTTFAYSDDAADYLYAFVVVEDGLWEYQTNYYSGSPGSLPWWDEQDEGVVWQYSHTGVGIYNCFGLKDSVPAKITKGERVEYSYDIPTSIIEDLNKSAVIALLLDRRSGVVMNAARVEADDYEMAGIDGVIADTDNLPVEYFNLQGIRISEPQPGVPTIRRQGSNAKIVVK